MFIMVLLCWKTIYYIQQNKEKLKKSFLSYPSKDKEKFPTQAVCYRNTVT